jgi:molybdopterin-guanine dinucleotide biosynthesis protein A
MMAKLGASVIGIVLAGGRGRRMNPDDDRQDGVVDKPLLDLAGKPLLQHVLERILPQVDAAVINANGDAARFEVFNLPVAGDSVGGYKGPLAGILAGLDWTAMNRPDVSHVLSVPGDSPFIPLDLVHRLMAALPKAADGLACAHSFGRKHPVVGLWPVSIRSDLRDQLVNHDTRKIDAFTAAYPVGEVDFSGVPDPFFNVNTPHDRKEAERILKATC